MYCNVLDNYNTNQVLPSTLAMKSLITFNIDEVAAAGSWVKSAVEINYQLPEYMIISGHYVSMPSLLELLTTSILQINAGINTIIDYNACSQPQVIRDDVSSGNIGQQEYLKIAGDIKSYAENTWIAPGYAYQTSLGTHFGFSNMVYTYSKIIDYYNQNKRLPASVAVQPWYIVSKSFKIDIVIGGTGGYVTNNYLINTNIPQTTASYEVVSAATQGTPMLTLGDGNGQKVMIVAGVHGNEIPATIAAMDIISYLNGKSIHGTLYVIPFAIPYNSATLSRYWQGQNPNSVANIPGTITNQILNLARELNVDALGDFHSTQPGGVPGQNAAMYSYSPTYESYVIASYISSHTGSALIGAYQAGVDYPGALEDVCNLASIPAVTCEVRSSHGTVSSGSIEMSFNQMMAFLSYHNLI
jgi:predicted deacylase